MFDHTILSSYTFIIVACGTFLLAMAAGAVGCISVLKGQSLIGDAIGHSTFPGIVFAFMLFMQRDPLILLFGAIISGTLAFSFIYLVSSNSKTGLDSALAIALSSFFGLGMVFKSYIQGNPLYTRASQSGLQNYIFGQAAYIMQKDLYIIFFVALLSLILIIFFYKELKVFVFDSTYARTIGIPSWLMYSIIIAMTISIIAAGLKLVGAILIASMLIIPAVTALQWSCKFSRVLVIAALSAGFSAVVGTYISTSCTGMSTGPTIIVIMSLIAFFSLLTGKHGIIANYIMRKKYAAK